MRSLSRVFVLALGLVALFPTRANASLEHGPELGMVAQFEDRHEARSKRASAMLSWIGEIMLEDGLRLLWQTPHLEERLRTYQGLFGLAYQGGLLSCKRGINTHPAGALPGGISAVCVSQ
ncbi:MAG: hypothetical protein Q7S26_00450 [bacterium]|nr:hypothetical protein [bacterium]